MNEAQLRNLTDREFLSQAHPKTELEFEIIRRFEIKLGLEARQENGGAFRPMPLALQK